MKNIIKIISTYLSFILIICAFPPSYTASENKDQSIKEKLVQTYLCGDDSIDKYEELYFHKNQKDEFDWALIYVTTYSETDVMIHRKLGNIVIEQDHGDIPFEVGYAIYDYEDNKFYDIIEVWDSDKYKDLHEVFTNVYFNKDLSIKEKLIQKYLCGDDSIDKYEELYFHKNLKNEFDWALIYATTYSSTDEMIYRKLGDIVIEQDHGNIPFEVGYAIYDYEDDKFYDIIEVGDSDKYKDLREVFINVYLKKDQSIKEKLVQTYLYGDDSIDKYEELYFHKNQKDEFDWALIYVTTYSETDVMIHRKLGDIVIEQNHGDIPFEVGYAIYDYENNKFYDIIEVWDSDEFNGLQASFQNYFYSKLPLGDANLDGNLSIVDATCIQRSLVGITQFNDYQDVLSDVNKSGDVDISDATLIQRYLAGMITDFSLI